MKSDSELMNELAHKTNYLHEMTSSESSAMKRALLDIYRDVAKLCEKEGLTLKEFFLYIFKNTVFASVSLLG